MAETPKRSVDLEQIKKEAIHYIEGLPQKPPSLTKSEFLARSLVDWVVNEVGNPFLLAVPPGSLSLHDAEIVGCVLSALKNARLRHERPDARGRVKELEEIYANAPKRKYVFD